MLTACVKIETDHQVGSGFFASPHYIVTCSHIVDGYRLDDSITYYSVNKKTKQFEKRSAVIREINAQYDLALLYSEDPAPQGLYLELDKIPPIGDTVFVYGYPNGEIQDNDCSIVLGDFNQDSELSISKANNIMRGYSGGPVCLKESSNKSHPTVVGIISSINVPDNDGKGNDKAWCIPASIILNLWKQYVCERKYSVKTCGPSNSFVYSELKTEYQDSAGNLKKLEKFLHDDRPVLWWAVVGDGGTGKSRLAYELALRQDSSWFCELFKVDDLTKRKLENLYQKAKRNLLIIADYAYFETNELGVWLYSFFNQRPTHKIRVLLLQREDTGESSPWKTSLMSQHRNLSELQYKESSLLLHSPDKKGIINLMRSYVKSVKKPEFDSGSINYEDLYRVLERVDSQLTRPLFAMFITDAAISGNAPTNWDRAQALEHFCNREMDLLTRSCPGNADVAEALWVIATISGSFQFRKDTLLAIQLEDIEELEKPDLFLRGLRRTNYLSGSRGTFTMRPMKPDLLGEYFVLSWFKKYTDDVAVVLDVANTFNNKTTEQFLTRLFRDYDSDEDIIKACLIVSETFYSLIVTGQISRNNTRPFHNLYKIQPQIFLSAHAQALAKDVGLIDSQFQKETLLDELRELKRLHPASPEVIEALARGIKNLYLGKKIRGIDDSLIEEAKELFASFQANQHIKEEYAEMLISSYRYYNSTEDKERTFAELHRVIKENPFRSTTRLTLLYSYILSEHFNTLFKDNRVSDAVVALEELRSCYASFPKHPFPPIEQNYRNALTSLLNKCRSENGDDLLLSLHNANHDNKSVSWVYASYLLKEIRKEPLKTNIIKKLRSLYEENTQDCLVSCMLAKGLEHAIEKQSTQMSSNYYASLYQIEQWTKELQAIYTSSRTELDAPPLSSIGGRLSVVPDAGIISAGEIACRYLWGLFFQLRAVTQMKEKMLTIEEMEKVYNEHSGHDMTEPYAIGLFETLHHHFSPMVDQKLYMKIYNLRKNDPVSYSYVASRMFRSDQDYKSKQFYLSELRLAYNEYPKEADLSSQKNKDPLENITTSFFQRRNLTTLAEHFSSALIDIISSSFSDIDVTGEISELIALLNTTQLAERNYDHVAKKTYELICNVPSHPHAIELCDILRTINNRYPSPGLSDYKQHTVKQYPDALVEIFNHTRNQEKRRQIIEEFQALSEEKEGNTYVDVRFACCLLNYCFCCLDTADLEDAQNKLRDLYLKSFRDIKLAVFLAENQLKLFLHNLSEPENAKTIIRLLRMVYKDHQDNTAISSCYVASLLTGCYILKDDVAFQEEVVSLILNMDSEEIWSEAYRKLAEGCQVNLDEIKRVMNLVASFLESKPDASTDEIKGFLSDSFQIDDEAADSIIEYCQKLIDCITEMT